MAFLVDMIGQSIQQALPASPHQPQPPMHRPLTLDVLPPNWHKSLPSFWTAPGARLVTHWQHLPCWRQLLLLRQLWYCAKNGTSELYVLCCVNVCSPFCWVNSVFLHNKPQSQDYNPEGNSGNLSKGGGFCGRNEESWATDKSVSKVVGGGDCACLLVCVSWWALTLCVCVRERAYYVHMYVHTQVCMVGNVNCISHGRWIYNACVTQINYALILQITQL